jgi:putative glycosyltransferase (TIGR04348 family)
MRTPTHAQKPKLCLVTPALADANNGNWQTAQRWARMLSASFQTRISPVWPDNKPADITADVLLALHARRSATSVAAWAHAHPKRPLVLALTGTDLYQDIHHDADAQRSLQLATHLIVLQEQGLQELPQALRHKAHVVYQSSTPMPPVNKTQAHLRAVMVGHLRDEKSPQVLWQTAQALHADDGIFIDHIGRSLDPALATQAQQTASQFPHYRWLNELSYVPTRRSIQRAHVLVHTSRIEGGAHVIMEAVLSGTPVLASRASGNVGMLGADYPGYFEPGNSQELAALLRECRQTQNQTDGLLAKLTQACQTRAKLFQPEREQADLCGLITSSLNQV